MKSLINTIIASAVAVLAAACTKELEQIPQVKAEATVEVSFRGIINGYSPQDETKASAQNVVRIMWAGGEQVYAYEGQKYIGTLTASVDGTDGTYAFLSGPIVATSEINDAVVKFSLATSVFKCNCGNLPTWEHYSVQAIW